MATMAAQTVAEWWAPGGEAFTTADLDRMPDDGHRYELVDGALVVTPGPDLGHQSVLGNLHLLLGPLCPSDLRILVAPFDVDLAEDTRVQPDILIAPRTQFTRRSLVGPPLLAIEVLSPSTQHIDRGLKRARYETAGCPSYWMVDPNAPSVLVMELADGAYSEIGRATGTESLDLQNPFPVRIVPADLAR